MTLSEFLLKLQGKIEKGQKERRGALVFACIVTLVQLFALILEAFVVDNKTEVYNSLHFMTQAVPWLMVIFAICYYVILREKEDILKTMQTDIISVIKQAIKEK